MKLLLENWREYLNEEQEFPYQIYCDMDGVLVDFEKGVIDYITNKLERGEADELYDIIARDHITRDDLKGPNRNKDIRDYMYEHLSNDADFWRDLPWMRHGQELWQIIAPYDPYILTAPMGYGSEIGKQEWIDKNLFPPPKKVFMSHDKDEWANKSSILIDDFTKNTIPWANKKGIAILHVDEEMENTIARLEELGVATT